MKFVNSRAMASSLLLLIVIAAAAAAAPAPASACSRSSKRHSKTFRSPKFSLLPGEVQNRYYRIEFPKGHLGVKSFFGEVVDENGAPVPLSEVYLHHWVVLQLYVKSQEKQAFLTNGYRGSDNPSTIRAGNDGICQNGILSQFWGLGSETRHTSNFVPDPYAINIGDPLKIPAGYEELWELNVHAIDSRGTVDPQGCLECRCDLYNVTSRLDGRPLPENYKGGLICCEEGARCKVKDGVQDEQRQLYLQYTIEWVEWDECVKAARTYILDVTDDRQRNSTDPTVGCKIEYEIPKCEVTNGLAGDCINTKQTTVALPRGGQLVYGVAHQHSGAKSIALHGEDGREICTSKATYGTGTEPGNEAGYVVGMGSCYPRPGSVRIGSNEKLKLTSYYSSRELHTGVMALFYVLVADDETSTLLQEVAVDWNMVALVAALALLALTGVLAALRLRKKTQSPAYAFLVNV